MHIADIFREHRTTFSFEFFPPKTDAASEELFATIAQLQELQPSFVSVTYGAGGSTRERTHDLIVRIQKETNLTAVSHLTCVCHTLEQLAAILDLYAESGVENILALGGDPPPEEEAGMGELKHAIELVELARAIGGFSIGVAAHPELHPSSNGDRDFDRRHLVAKMQLADFAITQFFFRSSDYLTLVDDLAKRGMHKPVIAGIMPITSLSSVQRMAMLSGCEVPSEVVAKVEAVADNPDDVRRVGVELATELCRDLLDRGVPGLHFYTLNRSTATLEVFADLGVAVRRG